MKLPALLQQRAGRTREDGYDVGQRAIASGERASVRPPDLPHLPQRRPCITRQVAVLAR